MKAKGREILNLTDGGIDIFKHYIETPFELEKETQNAEKTNKFRVFWSNTYENYVVSINTETENVRWNAVWFVKEKFDLTEEETYKKIKEDLGIEIVLDV